MSIPETINKMFNLSKNGTRIYIDGLEVDEQTAIEHKAICVRQLLGSKYTQEELEQYCALYKITIEQFYQHH